MNNFELSDTDFKTCFTALSKLLAAFEILFHDTMLDIDTRDEDICMGISSATSTKPNKFIPHAKLEIVKEYISRAGNEGAVDALGHFVQLEQNETYTMMIAEIRAFSATVKQVYSSKTEFGWSAPEADTTKTKQRLEPGAGTTYLTRDFMQDLHGLLTKGMGNCPLHSARIHLPMSPGDESGTPQHHLNIYLSKCPDHDEWQQARCMIKSAPDRRILPDHREVSSLCSIIKQSHHRRQMLSLLIAKEKLWTKFQRREAAQAACRPPSKSLRHLLDEGHFKKQKGERLPSISLKEQKVLVVILAHIMLQLCGSPWIRHTWTADNILFPPDSRREKKSKISQPYLNSSLTAPAPLNPYLAITPPNLDPDMEDPIHKYPLILDFAQLLLEIQCGETLQATEEDCDQETNEETPDTRFFMIDRISRQARDYMPLQYNVALDACLDCDIFPNENGSFDDIGFRKLVYEKIVVPLENDLYYSFGLKVKPPDSSNPPDKAASTQPATTKRPLKKPSVSDPVICKPVEYSAKGIAASQIVNHTYVETATVKGGFQTTNYEVEVSQTITCSEFYTSDSYTVAIICPMGVELAPVVAMLDNPHRDLPFDSPRYKYRFGSIGKHNVVVAVLPDTGNNKAAALAIQLQNDFKCLKYGLLVGIGGGIPHVKTLDIRLGDVVVSKPTGSFGGVVQFDKGKKTPYEGFERTGSLNKPPDFLSSTVNFLFAEHQMRPSNIVQHLSKMQQDFPQMVENNYVYQGAENDILFDSSYNHQSGGDCKSCNKDMIVNRTARRINAPKIHYGTIGSSNAVIKDAREREKLRQTLGIICIEMEAAGLTDEFPCLVIRGICDYADSHKSKGWQPYAAAAAAAFAKEFLYVL
ncbi:hypothetical protein TWF694_010016 [Orbilia ellipsospora]|uniref:Nucleoside phosphorylase domain-containing protein n=1 Tax=Orbilia ellipsospora TaxID=2528407 RepID=A0AAV9XA03_9PEZI